MDTKTQRRAKKLDIELLEVKSIELPIFTTSYEELSEAIHKIDDEYDNYAKATRIKYYGYDGGVDGLYVDVYIPYDDVYLLKKIEALEQVHKDKEDKNTAKERAEYERLKAKFGDK